MNLTRAKQRSIGIKHSIERALERYNLKLNLSDYNSLVAQIQQNEAVFIKRVSNTRSVWAVKHQHGTKRTKLAALYCTYTESILSFFPKSFLKGNKDDHRRLLLDYTNTESLEECFKKVVDIFQKYDMIKPQSEKEEENNEENPD